MTDVAKIPEQSSVGNGGFATASMAHDSGVPSVGRSNNGQAPLINVQPVRNEELQPSYAQNLGRYSILRGI